MIPHFDVYGSVISGADSMLGNYALCSWPISGPKLHLHHLSATPASPIASNYPVNEQWAPLAVNGTRAPLRGKLGDRPKLTRKAPKTNRSPKCFV